MVLVKDFDLAKQRLAPALDPARRRALAQGLAERALAAAGPDAIVVAGSEEAADLARRNVREVVREAEPAGQRPAARRGIERALELGAEAVLVVSSDLPRVTAAAIDAMLAAGRAMGVPAVLAAPAIGRGGTNALYLAPPRVIDLHFGADSLPLFEADARSRDVPFALFEEEAFALDLDEPSDLELAALPDLA